MGTLLTPGKNKQTKVKLQTSLVYVLGISLLTVACYAQSTKQSTSVDTTSDLLAANDESDNSDAGNKPKLICKNYTVTGTRFKKRVCESQEQYTARIKAERENTDEYKRRIDERTTLSPGGSIDSSGGRMMNPNNP